MEQLFLHESKADPQTPTVNIDTPVPIDRKDTPEIALMGYSQQIPSVCLAILNGIPSVADFMMLYRASTFQEKEQMLPSGYELVVCKIASKLENLGDISLIYRDATAIFTDGQLSFRFFEFIIDRLVQLDPGNQDTDTPTIPEILREMQRRGFPGTHAQSSFMLQSQILSRHADDPLLDTLVSLHPPFSPHFCISMVDRCRRLAVAARIPYTLRVAASLLGKIHPIALNHAVPVLAESGQLHHAVYYLTELSAIRQTWVSRAAFVAVVVGLQLRGDVRLAARCRRGMRDAEYDDVRPHEWIDAVSARVDVQRVREYYAGGEDYKRFILCLLGSSKRNVLLDDDLVREVVLESPGSCHLGVHVVLEKIRHRETESGLREWRKVLEGMPCCEKTRKLWLQLPKPFCI